MTVLTDEVDEAPVCYLELFEDKGGKWRVRLKGNNHEIIMSGQAYGSHRNAYRAAKLIADWVRSGAYVEIKLETGDQEGREGEGI